MAIEYRTYAIGADDRIVSRIEMVCDDDDDAKERARQLVDDQAIELWRGDKWPCSNRWIVSELKPPN